MISPPDAPACFCRPQPAFPHGLTSASAHWALRTCCPQTHLLSRVSWLLPEFLLAFPNSWQNTSDKSLHTPYNMLCTQLTAVMFQGLTKLRTIISEPAWTARCKGVNLDASWTLELTLAWTLIRNRTLSISEF